MSGTEKDAALRMLEVPSGRESTLLRQSALGEGVRFVLQSTEYTDVTKVWVEPSPDGKSIAFLSTERKPSTPRAVATQALEASDPDWRMEVSYFELARLWVMDLATRNARALTDDAITVDWFSWSSDSQKLAISASKRLDDTFFMGDDIYVLDVSSRELRPVVQSEGWDRQPVWSPDGQYIAFGSQKGREDWRYGATLAVVHAGSGRVRYIGAALDRIAGPPMTSLRWRNDGNALELQNAHQLGLHLFRVAASDGKTQRVTPEGRTYSSFYWSRDGTQMAFIEEGVGIPPEITLSRADRFEPRRLTHLNPEWDAVSRPVASVVTWPSRDGRWTIHGLLIKPSTYREGRRYPLLVVNFGGPKMVRQLTNPVSNYPLLALAEAGYLVLLPNSRGREGYGSAFLQAIRDEHSYVGNPSLDVLDGVKAMIDRGIADPQALGMLGFSYGEALTMAALVRSPDFKAAIVGGGASDLFLKIFDVPSRFAPLNRDILGLPDSFDPQTVRRAFEQTAIFALNKVRTPVLIESGEHDGYVERQRLFRGLRYFGIPAEHNVYPRTGHGVEEPLLLQDSYSRQAAWLDYWLRDKPYRDTQLQREYDAWKLKRFLPQPGSRVPTASQ